MIGIYRIKNLINSKCYYGSSKQIEKRFKKHKKQLKNNTHINCILQKAWNKYGEDNFLFEIVEECNLNILLEVEQKYLDLQPEYNIGIKSSGGDNLTKNPNKDKIVKKMTESVIRRYDSMTDEEKKEKHSYPMELNPNWKGGLSISYCEICDKKISQGAKRCLKHIEFKRDGVKNPFFGKQHSDETKKKLSEKRLGNYNGEQNIPIIIDDIEYRSSGEASKILNIPMVTIRWRVLSKNPKYKKYHYKGQEKIFYSEEEQKERLSNPQKGKQTKFNKPFIIDGIEYRTLKEAGDKLNVHPMTIKGRLKSPKFDNYKYKD
jgi:group I intron endonuclease